MKTFKDQKTTDNEKADRIGKSLTYHYRYYLEKKKEKEKINEEIARLKKKLAELQNSNS